MILLDSSVIIELFRKKNKDHTLFYLLTQLHNEFSISTITQFEIGVGNKKLHAEFWENLCQHFSILPFDSACADSAVVIYTELQKQNKLIDFADIMIASTAITHQIPIATLNIKHFNRVKGLELITLDNL